MTSQNETSPDKASPGRQSRSAWRLDNRRALITGGSSGIGLALATEMAWLGADLVLVARSQQKLDAAAEQITGQVPGCRVETRSTDLAVDAQRQELAASLDKPLHILVNNAGFNIRKTVAELTLAEYQRVQEVNMTSCFEMCRLLYPLLRESAPACVVNNASVAGLTHLRTGAAYATSKAAMIQLTRNLAVEWAEDSIRVNAVAPWYIETPLARQVLQDPDYRRDVLDRTPMKRIGQVDECARAMAFLCLPAAGYVTGHCLAIDGGFSVFGF